MAIFTSLFCSCVKQGNVTTYAVDSSLVKYFNYKPGTYWVYRDSIAGDVDSFYVTRNNVDYATSTNNADIRTENIDILISQVNIVKKTSTVWDWNMGANMVSFESSDRAYSPMFYYPFTVGPLQLYDPIPDTAMTIISAYIINTTTFTNVEEIKYADSWENMNDGYI